VILFSTPRGTVVIEVHDPGIVVTFANDEITLDSSGKKYKLKTTEKKTLKVLVDGVEIDTGTREITVSKNETKLITAKLLPDKQLELVIAGETKMFAVPGKPAKNVAATHPNSSAPPRAIAPFDAAQAKAHQEAWAKHLGVSVEYTNSIGMKFRLIPPGKYLRGSTEDEIEAATAAAAIPGDWKIVIGGEAPRHHVTLTQPFYLCVHETTQQDYETVLGKRRSYFSPSGPGRTLVEGVSTDRFPVESVSLLDAAEFCEKLSQQEQLTPFYFRFADTVMPSSNDTPAGSDQGPASARSARPRRPQPAAACRGRARRC
jgi:formylglycine-generating enzyme required for sulfatase activity